MTIQELIDKYKRRQIQIITEKAKERKKYHNANNESDREMHKLEHLDLCTELGVVNEFIKDLRIITREDF